MVKPTNQHEGMINSLHHAIDANEFLAERWGSAASPAPIGNGTLSRCAFTNSAFGQVPLMSCRFRSSPFLAASVGASTPTQAGRTRRWAIGPRHPRQTRH